MKIEREPVLKCDICEMEVPNLAVVNYPIKGYKNG